MSDKVISKRLLLDKIYSSRHLFRKLLSMSTKALMPIPGLPTMGSPSRKLRSKILSRLALRAMTLLALLTISWLLFQIHGVVLDISLVSKLKSKKSQFKLLKNISN